MKKSFLAACLFLGPLLGNQTPSQDSTPVKRIITFTPSLTEMVFSIGAGDLVVGTTDWCHYPPEAKTREKLGGVYTPNYEKIVSLKPDLFIVSAVLKDVIAKTEKLGIRVLPVYCETLEDVDRGIEFLGKTLGKQKEAQKLRDEMKARFESVQKKIERAKRPKVLLVLERQPGTVLDLSVVGSKNVIDSLIQLAGGENIFGDSAFPYPKASKEEILSRNPDIILDFSVHGYTQQGDDGKELQAWRQLNTIRAVQEKKVFIMPEGFDMYPGPRVPQIVEEFARRFHPERFEK